MKKGFSDIITSRFIIRNPRVSDAENMFYNWASDDEVTKYLTWYSHATVSVTEMIIQMWISNEVNTFNWIIESNATKEAIGTISLYNVDFGKKYCELGFCLSKKYWNQGIMTEAVGLMIYYAFKKGIRSIVGYHMRENVGSGIVMKKNLMIHYKSENIKNVKDQSDICLDYYRLTYQRYKKYKLKENNNESSTNENKRQK